MTQPASDPTPNGQLSPSGLSSILLNRRSFFAATSATVTAATALARDYGPRAEPVRYPDPDIIELDARFKKYKLGNAPIQRLFRNPAGNSNGNTFDHEGRQIACEHGNRRVVRYEYNGKVTVLADKYNGKIFNAPNDVVVHPDGGIWFTDPGYGALMNYEGHKGEMLLKEAVYRIDPKNGKIDLVTDAQRKPNGLCFSPDYQKLYIADTGASHYEGTPKNIHVHDVTNDGKSLGKGKEFVSMMMVPHGSPAGTEAKAGFADGIRADVDGNIWASSGWVGAGYDGVQVFAPDGARIGLILLPEICGNVCFGGTKRNRLFMCGSQSLYSVFVETQGAHIC
jgi:gluconolactonase